MNASAYWQEVVRQNKALRDKHGKTLPDTDSVCVTVRGLRQLVEKAHRAGRTDVHQENDRIFAGADRIFEAADKQFAAADELFKSVPPRPRTVSRWKFWRWRFW